MSKCIDPKNFNDIISRAQRSGKIQTHTLITGDAYLLHASKVAHRVTECLSDDDYRLATSLDYCENVDQIYGKSVDLLYDG